MAQIASPDSIPALQKAFVNTEVSIVVRRTALTALQKIGTEDAINILTEACKEDPAVGIQACKLLGELGYKKAVPLLSKGLAALGRQYRKWRTIRDSEREDFSEEEAEAWRIELVEARPQPGWTFELAHAMARIDPEKTAVELLSHDIADVRYGAWMGMGSVGNVKLLKELHRKLVGSSDPLFRYAAYRAMDEILIHLETTGGSQELIELKNFYRQVQDHEGIGDRVEWTIKQLEWANL